MVYKCCLLTNDSLGSNPQVGTTDFEDSESCCNCVKIMKVPFEGLHSDDKS